MKKIFILFVALLSVVLQGKAQQYINIYQDDVIIRQFSTNEIDSISVTETEPRIISLWQSDEVIVTYSAAEVDSIKLTSVGGDPLAYIGIVGFNDDLYVKNIDILSSSTASQYRTFVNNLPRKDGTLLYYAVDNALDMLDKANIQTPLRSVNFITFTDGLDQGSMMMSDKYGSSSAYLEAMSQRIAKTRINDLPINAYSVGLRGNDVSNNTQFSQNLQSLASSSDKAFEVSSINDLRTKLQDIAKQIISVSTRQSISIKVPGIDNGTRMRFVFDGKSAANSSQYIEGTFNLQDRSLYDVTYHGMKSVSGSFVQGTQNGIFVTYTFTGIRSLSGDGLVSTSSITHYYRLPGSTSWQVNSDFSPAGNTKRSVSHSGTSIVLVLDCSSSLGSDFSRMQQYANDFIDQVAANAEPFELQAPSNFKAAFSEDGVNLTWDAVKYAQNYEIWRCGSADGSFVKIAENLVLNSWTDESPLEGTNYYRLYAICYGSTSPCASAQITFELPAPSNFTAAFSEDGVNLTWDAVKCAQNYEIWRCGSAYGSFVKIAENIVSNSWTDESPLDGKNYYRLYAIGYGRTSPYASAQVTFELQAPSNFKAAFSEDGVNLTWDAVKYAQNYEIWRSGSAYGSFEKMAENLVSNSWTDESPLEGTNYYRLYAICYGSISPYASAQVTFELQAPSNFKAAFSEDGVNLTWRAVKYAQNYEIWRCGSADGSFVKIAENLVSNSWTDESPLEGENYYRLYAICYGSTSPYASAQVTFELQAPSNFKAAFSEDGTSVNLTWDAVKYAKSYEIWRCWSSYGSFEKIAENIVSNSWTDESPLDGTNYYRLYATCYGSTSPYASVQVTFELPAPSNFVANFSKDGVKLTWDAVKYAQNYEIWRSGSASSSMKIAENIVSNSWTDESPLEGKNYYSLYAICRGSTSPNAFTQITFEPQAPSNFKAAYSEDGVNLTWDALEYAQNYEIWRSGSADGSFVKIAENIVSNSWTDESPLDGTNYYRLYAICYGSTSPYASARVTSSPNPNPVLVDLGLPSGTLWADRNVGAKAPEEYGDYFAWGETEPKSDYSWSTYKYGKDEDELTKYCSKSSYGKDGYTDKFTELELQDDAASVNWGGNWRMPSFEQIKELYNNTDNTWVDDFEGTGVSGRKFTNKEDSSKFIFLPAAGYRSGTSLSWAGSDGYYWSRTLNTGSPYEARIVNFGSGSVNLYGYDGRYYGHPVRPVVAP